MSQTGKRVRKELGNVRHRERPARLDCGGRVVALLRLSDASQCRMQFRGRVVWCTWNRGRGSSSSFFASLPAQRKSAKFRTGDLAASVTMMIRLIDCMIRSD